METVWAAQSVSSIKKTLSARKLVLRVGYVTSNQKHIT